MRGWIVQLLLCGVILLVVFNVGFTAGWERRNAQEPRQDAVTRARYQKIDAALRGFVEDDR